MNGWKSEACLRLSVQLVLRNSAWRCVSRRVRMSLPPLHIKALQGEKRAYRNFITARQAGHTGKHPHLQLCMAQIVAGRIQIRQRSASMPGTSSCST